MLFDLTMSHISAIHCFRHANIAHICAHIGSTHCATSRGGRSTLAVAEPSGGDGSIQTCRRGGQGIWSGRVAATCGGERPDRPTHTPSTSLSGFGDWHAARGLACLPGQSPTAGWRNATKRHHRYGQPGCLTQRSRTHCTTSRPGCVSDSHSRTTEGESGQPAGRLRHLRRGHDQHPVMDA